MLPPRKLKAAFLVIDGGINKLWQRLVRYCQKDLRGLVNHHIQETSLAMAPDKCTKMASLFISLIRNLQGLRNDEECVIFDPKITKRSVAMTNVFKQKVFFHFLL